ncbi:hypothetical protein C8R45DRAFT_939992 [Mycena sanguinolenta]|nr:hypothetical protein C8R45DRAFT_939992 [Mycena sanguinolenta]
MDARQDEMKTRQAKKQDEDKTRHEDKTETETAENGDEEGVDEDNARENKTRQQREEYIYKIYRSFPPPTLHSPKGVENEYDKACSAALWRMVSRHITGFTIPHLDGREWILVILEALVKEHSLVVNPLLPLDIYAKGVVSVTAIDAETLYETERESCVVLGYLPGAGYVLGADADVGGRSGCGILKWPSRRDALRTRMRKTVKLVNLNERALLLRVVGEPTSTLA